jgi:geranylgeranylglycerol-phosphate geranylgeranyltransferase
MALQYEGIREGYPRLRRRFGKLVGYVQLVRPFTLLAPLFAGVFGVLIPVRELTFSSLLTAVYAGVTLALAQASGQCLNQYVDSELDKIVKPYRPIPSGLITREEALGLAWILAIIAVARAFTLNTFFGLITLALIFFAVFYSLPPFSPRKINPVLNTAWMAVSRGFLPMFAVWSIYGSISDALPYAILAFLWVFGFQASKDVPDMEGDKLFNIKTIPNTYGRKGLVVVMAISTALFTITSVALKIHILLLLIPLALFAIVTVQKQSTLTENTYSWLAFYLGLAFLYFLLFLNSVFSLL